MAGNTVLRFDCKFILYNMYLATARLIDMKKRNQTLFIRRNKQLFLLGLGQRDYAQRDLRTIRNPFQIPSVIANPHEISKVYVRFLRNKVKTFNVNNFISTST